MRTTLDSSAQASLVDLLGQTRSRVVDVLRASPSTVATLAEALGLSEVAVRRHLQVLERDGLVDAETVRRDGPGRPSSRYTLSARGRRLFPDRSADLANELLDYLADRHGRQALLDFLRWRQQRQETRYDEALGGEPNATVTPQRLQERADKLAELLTEDGFLTEAGVVTTPDGATTLQLRQQHCAISDVAREHPELCAYEAALFRKVLGAKVSRRQTIAAGADSCVCHVTLPDTLAEPPAS